MQVCIRLDVLLMGFLAVAMYVALGAAIAMATSDTKHCNFVVGLMVFVYPILGPLLLLHAGLCWLGSKFRS